MHTLVRQHRVADDVADGKDVRHVGTHLFIDRNEAALIHRDTGIFRTDLLAIRTTARRLQDQVVTHGFGRRRVLAFELDP